MIGMPLLPFAFLGQNGKYLHFHDDGLSADSEDAQPFYLELRDPTRMCIKTAQGRYVNSEKNGGLGMEKNGGLGVEKNGGLAVGSSEGSHTQGRYVNSEKNGGLGVNSSHSGSTELM